MMLGSFFVVLPVLAALKKWKSRMGTIRLREEEMRQDQKGNTVNAPIYV